MNLNVATSIAFHSTLHAMTLMTVVTSLMKWVAVSKCLFLYFIVVTQAYGRKACKAIKVDDNHLFLFSVHCALNCSPAHSCLLLNTYFVPHIVLKRFRDYFM